jgi:hypothetical protein
MGAGLGLACGGWLTGQKWPEVVRSLKVALRVYIRANVVAMVVAQGLLNFEEDLSAFSVRLTLPEHHKSLAAYAAACFSVTVGWSA